MVPVGSVRINEQRFQELAVTDLITSEITRRVNAAVYHHKKLRLSKTMGYMPDVLRKSESFGENGLWALGYCSGITFRRDGESADEQFTQSSVKPLSKDLEYKRASSQILAWILARRIARHVLQ